MHKNGNQDPSNCPYRQVVGSLMYLSIGTRPDITFSVNCASQYLEEPKKIHWNACKRILKYLIGTIDHRLYFPARQKNCLQAFSDADYAGDVKTRKSTTGLVIKIDEATIAWSSLKQNVVTLSTTEAEYVAASQTVKEIIWVKSLLSDLALFNDLKTTLHIDNMSAIKLIKNPEFHQRSKHIDVRYHFIRDKYKEEKFILEHTASKDQQADLLTKPLPKMKLETQKKMLNILSRKKTNLYVNE